MEEKNVKPIWYFVGLILIIMGGIVLLTGLYYLWNPSDLRTVLAETHPNIWWGTIMIVFGTIMYWKTRK